MAYKVVVEPDAQDDIDEAFEYYLSVTDNAKVITNLYNDIEQAYDALNKSFLPNTKQTV